MLGPELKDILADRLEGWELVEFLQIPVQDVIEIFEDEILANLEDVKEFAGLRELDNDNE